MARLTSPKGVTVDVSDDKAAVLASLGYKAESKAPAKSASSKSSSK